MKQKCFNPNRVTNDKTDSELHHTIRKSINYFTNFIVPLYVEQRGKPILLGTGFFVELPSGLALVSAAHVLKDVSERNPLYVYRGSNDVVQVTGKRFLSDIEGIDLGFVLTEGIDLPWETTAKFACKLEYLQPVRTPRASRRYAIAGYPETKNRANPARKTIDAVVHAYHAHSIEDNEYINYGLDPNVNIALPLDLKKGIDPDGNNRTFPKPQGMSGAPIWELFDEGDHADNPRTFPIVGVATTYLRKSKIVYGTDIGPLIEKLQGAT